MMYGQIKKLLFKNYMVSDEVFLMESSFQETSRTGKYLRSVVLEFCRIVKIRPFAHLDTHGISVQNFIPEPNGSSDKVIIYMRLTSKNLAVASTVYCVKVQRTCEQRPRKYEKQLRLLCLYPLGVIKIFVFKQHSRKSLKAITTNGVRYFQLSDTPKQKIYWDIWCNYCQELNRGFKTWPFCRTSSTDISRSKVWLDKYLYLGRKREEEDSIRPKPIPGLGVVEEMKLLYLKPQYFGCFGQSEHWVQCDNSKTER